MNETENSKFEWNKLLLFMNSHFSEQRKANKQLLVEDVLESDLNGYGKSSKDSFLEMRGLNSSLMRRC